MGKWNFTSTVVVEVLAPNREEGETSWFGGENDSMLPIALSTELERLVPQADANDGKSYELDILFRAKGYYYRAILNPPDRAQPEESDEERTVEGVTLVCDGEVVSDLLNVNEWAQQTFEKAIGEEEVDYEVYNPNEE